MCIYYLLLKGYRMLECFCIVQSHHLASAKSINLTPHVLVPHYMQNANMQMPLRMRFMYQSEIVYKAWQLQFIFVFVSVFKWVFMME